jgi:hypothetical protein
VNGRKTPSEKAARDLRRDLGATPMKALFEVLVGPVAAPDAEGVDVRCNRPTGGFFVVMQTQQKLDRAALERSPAHQK